MPDVKVNLCEAFARGFVDKVDRASWSSVSNRMATWRKRVSATVLRGGKRFTLHVHQSGRIALYRSHPAYLSHKLVESNIHDPESLRTVLEAIQ